MVTYATVSEKRPVDVFLPPGKYFICDPCYVLPDDEWSQALDSTGFFGLYKEKGKYNVREHQHGVFSRNGILFAVSSTAHGDGVYPVYVNAKLVKGVDCSVDAGIIGAIPVGISAVANLDPLLGYIHIFTEPFTIKYHNGDIIFGDVTVKTDI